MNELDGKLNMTQSNISHDGNYNSIVKTPKNEINQIPNIENIPNTQKQHIIKDNARKDIITILKANKDFIFTSLKGIIKISIMQRINIIICKIIKNNSIFPEFNLLKQPTNFEYLSILFNFSYSYIIKIKLYLILI